MTTLTVTFKAGESVSDNAITLPPAHSYQITVPPTYTAISPGPKGGSISFLASETGERFSDLCMDDGTAPELTVLRADTTIIFPAQDSVLSTLPFLKLRSGSRLHAIVQEKDTSLTIECVGAAAKARRAA
jgi:hypothetical protein